MQVNHAPAPLPPNWHMGVVITNRESEPENCSCPNRSVWFPCFNYCYGIPHWFHDASTTSSTGYKPEVSMMMPGFFTGWVMDNADVMGQRMKFEGKECCGTDSCCEPEVHAWDKGPEGGMDTYLGKVVARCYCCPCGEETMSEAFDANGQSRMRRTENCCWPEFFYYHNDGCFHSYKWPITDNSGMRSTSVKYSYHCCTCCYGTMSGVEHFPPNASAVDQKLLVTMAVMRWWRIGERLKEEERDDTTGGQ